MASQAQFWRISSPMPSFVFHFRVMHRLKYILLASVFPFGCKQEVTTWNHCAAPASIRSLDVISNTEIRYAGSNGWVGRTQNGGDQWIHEQWNAPDGSQPSFRSSGWNGKSWFAVSIASPAWIVMLSESETQPNWVHQDTSANAFLDAMAWWNEAEGVVFGDPVDGCLTLLVTRDGGQTWTPTPCPDVPKHTEGEAGFAASNGNICIVGDTAWVFTGGVASRCLRSVDRGASWNATPLPIRQGETMTGVFAASFADSKNGLAMGGHWEYPEDNHGNLIGTTDGGETWNLLAEGTGPGYRSSIVHHPIRRQEIACTGFRGLDISKDGGKTWIHVNDSSRYVARFSPDGRTLWLAGKQTISSVDWDEIATLD